MNDFNPEDTCTAVVESWTLGESKSNFPQLRLNVRLLAQLVDSKRPEQGTKPLPPGVIQQVSTSITFGNNTDAAKSIEMATRDLRSIGINLTENISDLERLNPAHPEAFNLEGKQIFVRKSSAGYWNLTTFGFAPAISADSLKNFRRNFGATWQQAVNKSKEAVPSKTRPAQDQNTPAQETAEIPF